MGSRDQELFALADELFALAKVGDPAAFEFVITTLCEHLLETDYEDATEFLREQYDQCLRTLSIN